MMVPGRGCADRGGAGHCRGINGDARTAEARSFPTSHARQACAGRRPARADEARGVMAAPTLVARMTAAEFRENRDLPDTAQLVHGEVVLVPPASRAHTRVMRAVFRALDAHVAPRQLGEVYPDGAGYELPHRGDTVRIPDVSFVRAGREPAVVGLRGFPRMAPDLAAEVLSPSETPNEIRKKRTDYLDAGTALVWLVDLDARGVEVWAPGAAPRWVGEDGTLDGSPLLPEFGVAVRELFAGVAREG